MYSLDKHKRIEIKKQWIDYLEYLIIPMFEEGFFTEHDEDNCYYYVELSKKKK